MDETIKALVKGYMEKAENRLKAAESLFELGYYDDVVSRAYYAVFHAVQALLLTEGEKAETHKEVLTLFSLLFIKTGRFRKEFGKYLSNLKDDRESGDYEVFSYIDEETAKNALVEAREFLDETELYLSRLGI